MIRKVRRTITHAKIVGGLRSDLSSTACCQKQFLGIANSVLLCVSVISQTILAKILKYIFSQHIT